MSDAVVLVAGEAEGPLLRADVGLSFWGGVDPATGLVIDRRHPLHGESLAGQVLAIPSGRGSCSASGVLLELIRAGRAPAALLFGEEDQILTLAAMLAGSVFGRSLPVLQLGAEAMRRLQGLDRVAVGAEGVSSGGSLIVAASEPKRAAVALADEDRAMLSGAQGPARRIAMETILRMAESFGANELVSVTRVHLDCCIHTGPASVEIAERFRDLGGRVAVPTTLNAISTDLVRWRRLGLDPAVSAASARQAQAYIDMGAAPSFTCAPYLADPPAAGEQIAWAESNAVAYANSVLGARTQKYPDYLDLCIALTGRAPLAGCHRPEGRRAAAHIHVEGVRPGDESFWPLLGYHVGLLSPHAIPAVTGLEAERPTPDDLKAFAAAFATSSAAPMVHIVGVTPEAPTLAAATGGKTVRRATVSRADLREAWTTLNPAPEGPIGLVAIGNPHSSVDELTRVAALTAGHTKAASVDLVVTTSRAVLAEAAEPRARLEAFGARFVTDTCWCMIETPIAPPRQGGIVTNSGKYAHYGPNLVGGPFFFASLAGCVEAACSGIARADAPLWLQDRS